MKVKILKCIAATWLIALGMLVNATAWDGTGHMLVAQIAYNRLNDKARARVDELAAQLKRNGVPYNAVNIACWPDDIKSRDSDSPFQGKFKPWHYVDIGCETNDPDVLSNPLTLTQTNGDVILALNHCVNLIRTKKTDALVPDEAVALALVVHFVGDIHQPLHTTARYNHNPRPDDKSKNDAGGNGVTITNLVDTTWPNLHTFWDEAYRRYYDNGEVKAEPRLNESDAPNSPALKEWLGRLKPAKPEGSPDLHFDVTAWVKETHVIACSQVYGTLGEPYGAKNVTLKELYVKEGTQTARRQIVLAGYRLAALLNDLYGQGAPDAPHPAEESSAPREPSPTPANP
jgi:S1/P1 nuclease